MKTGISFPTGDLFSPSFLIILFFLIYLCFLRTLIIWRLDFFFLVLITFLLFFHSYFSVGFSPCSGHFPDYRFLFVQLFLIFKSSFSNVSLSYRDVFFFFRYSCFCNLSVDINEIVFQSSVP